MAAPEGGSEGTGTQILASAEDLLLVEALRAGDQGAFTALVDRYQGPMLRLAGAYVPTRAAAEEVVQDAWIGVLKGLDRFEGRSSLKTWIFRILTNTAKTRGERERRVIPFASLVDAEHEPAEPSVDRSRFAGPKDEWPGGWLSPPASWEAIPEARMLSKETFGRVGDALRSLPTSQREVMTLRDVEGWSSSEVCNALRISETNQRVLLHRARSKVRAALEPYLREG